jgi:YHS domain-containing protein
MLLDPVCLVEIDETRAPRRTYGGRTYAFCSLECAWEFDLDPEEFAPQDDMPTPSAGAEAPGGAPSS